MTTAYDQRHAISLYRKSPEVAKTSQKAVEETYLVKCSLVNFFVIKEGFPFKMFICFEHSEREIKGTLRV